MNAQERAKQLAAAMNSLCRNPNFHAFMDEVEEMKDVAVRDLVNDAVVGDSSKLLAGLGEVRTYLAVLDLYQHHLDNAVQNTVDANE